MTTMQNSHIRNGLLTALAPDDLALLAPHLREVLLLPGDLLHQPGEKIEQVYFLQNGIVSLMAVLEEGEFLFGVHGKRLKMVWSSQRVTSVI